MGDEKIKKKAPKKKRKINIILFALFIVFILSFVLAIIFKDQIKEIIDSHYDDTSAAEEIEDFYNNDLVGEEGQVEETVSETNIRKVFEISGLQTADYIYNSVVRVYDEDEKEILYYVSYEGTIIAGINFEDIDVEINDADKKILLTVPEVEIQDTIVNNGTLDFIFMKDKYDTDETYNEAYKKCQDDLDNKAKNEADLLLTAQENAEQVVKALTSPWIEQLYPDYVIEIKKGGEK